MGQILFFPLLEAKEKIQKKRQLRLYFPLKWQSLKCTEMQKLHTATTANTVVIFFDDSAYSKYDFVQYKFCVAYYEK